MSTRNHILWDNGFDCIFDVPWYGDVYRGFFDDGAEDSVLTAFYINEGHKLGQNPNPLFDTLFYQDRLGFSFGGKCGLFHYIDQVRAGNPLSPHWLFSEEEYLRANPDVHELVQRGLIRSGYVHFLGVLESEDRRISRFFNSHYYASKYGCEPKNAILHYLRSGRAKQYVPTPLVVPDWYVRNSTLRGCLRDEFLGGPYEHFMRYGEASGVNCTPDFDPEFYLSSYPDIAASVASGERSSAFEHFIKFGIYENRKPNKYFHPDFYLMENPAVKTLIEAGLYSSAFEHFLGEGYSQNLRAAPPISQLAVDLDSTKIAFQKSAMYTCRRVLKGSPRKLPSCNAPHLSIIIPVHNQIDFTIRCLESIRAQDFDSYEVILFDNSSSDATKQVAALYQNLIVVNNHENIGYTGACNEASKLARGEIIIFANNDIELAFDALRQTADFLSKYQDAGAVGGKVLNTAGDLQEAGCGLWADGSTFGFGRGSDPTGFAYQGVREVDFCSGCFLAVRASLFQKLGRFDMDFSPGYYEEVDLCFRIWKEGYRVYYTSNIELTHFEYASFARGRPPEASHSQIEVKKKVFLKKHGDLLSCDGRLLPSRAGHHVQSDASMRNRPIVLIVEDLVPVKTIGSGFVRTNDFVKIFVELGYGVLVLVKDSRLDIESKIDAADIHGAKLLLARDVELLPEIVRLVGNIQIIHICRSHNAAMLSEHISQIRGIQNRPLLVFDTEAIGVVRDRFHHLPANWKDNTEVISAVKEELKHAQLFDKIIYVNKVDADLARCSGINTPFLEIPGQSNQFDGPISICERKNMLFLGAVHSRYSPNYEGLWWFIENVLPAVRASRPNTILTVAGYWNPNLEVSLLKSNDAVEYLGEVTDIGKVFGMARLFVVPNFSAAGIPQKCLDVMSNGLPAVVTPTIAAQLGFSGDAGYLIGQDAQSFANACLTLLGDTDSWNAASAAALASAKSRFTPEIMKESVRALCSP